MQTLPLRIQCLLPVGGLWGACIELYPQISCALRVPLLLRLADDPIRRLLADPRWVWLKTALAAVCQTLLF